MEDIFSVANLVVGLITGGGLSAFFFLRENKAAKRIENDKNASETWRILFDEELSRHEHTRGQLDALRSQYEAARDQVAQLSIKNNALDMMRCTRNGCQDRQPPREWEKP